MNDASPYIKPSVSAYRKRHTGVGKPKTESRRSSCSESVWISSWISICSSCSHLFLTRGTCGLSMLVCAEVNGII